MIYKISSKLFLCQLADAARLDEFWEDLHIRIENLGGNRYSECFEGINEYVSGLEQSTQVWAKHAAQSYMISPVILLRNQSAPLVSFLRKSEREEAGLSLKQHLSTDNNAHI